MMGVVFVVIFFIGTMVFCVFFLFPLINDYSKAKQAGEIQCGFCCSCGGKIDNTYLSFPLIKIKLAEKYLVVSHSGISIDCFYSAIRDIDIKNGVTTNGIYFSCLNKDFLLWTPYSDKILRYILSKK